MLVCMTSSTAVVFHAAAFKPAEGYRCHRVPAIAKLPNNEIIVVAEGRKHDCQDHGYVDMIYRYTLLSVAFLISIP